MTMLGDAPTMIYVDVTNLYFTAAKKFGRKLNYDTLVKKLKNENKDIRGMHAYASFRHHYAPFISLLTNLGFAVQHKTIDSYLPHVTWSCKMTIDVLQQEKIEKFIFLTNDYGLIPLYEYLAKHDRFVEVWSPLIPPAVQQAATDTFEFGEGYCANAIAKPKKDAATT